MNVYFIHSEGLRYHFFYVAVASGAERARELFRRQKGEHEEIEDIFFMSQSTIQGVDERIELAFNVEKYEDVQL